MGMTYDPVRQVCVLFGGHSGCPGGFAAETWEYDGTTWAQRTPQGGVTPPGHGAMTFDPTKGKVLLATFATTSYELWTWDGNAWVRLHENCPVIGSMVFDPATASVIGVGAVPNGSGYDTITYRLTTTGWQQIATEVLLSPPSGVIIYDSVQSKLVRLAGTYTGPLGMYVWNGSAWNAVPTTLPPGRAGFRFEFNANVGKSILICGHDGSGLRGDSWQYTSSSSAIIQHPTTVNAYYGAPAVFSVVGPLNTSNHRWRKDGVPLIDTGRIAGSGTSQLTINYVSDFDGGAYDCVLTTNCGEIRSNGAALIPQRQCTADTNKSGSVTIDDLFLFLNAYFTGCP